MAQNFRPIQYIGSGKTLTETLRDWGLAPLASRAQARAFWTECEELRNEIESQALKQAEALGVTEVIDVRPSTSGANRLCLDGERAAVLTEIVGQEAVRQLQTVQAEFVHKLHKALAEFVSARIGRPVGPLAQPVTAQEGPLTRRVRRKAQGQ